MLSDLSNNSRYEPKVHLKIFGVISLELLGRILSCKNTRKIEKIKKKLVRVKLCEILFSSWIIRIDNIYTVITQNVRTDLIKIVTTM